jgi:hypothetical protein
MSVEDFLALTAAPAAVILSFSQARVLHECGGLPGTPHPAGLPGCKGSSSSSAKGELACKCEGLRWAFVHVSAVLRQHRLTFAP